MKEKCILFCRVSTSKQDWERQKKSLLEMAHNDGYTDDDIKVIGKHESGYKLQIEEREGLNELYRRIERNEVECVYIWELSRLARRQTLLLSIRDFLVENKVQLICNEPSFKLLKKVAVEDESTEDESTPKFTYKLDEFAEMAFTICGLIAEQEVRLKKARFADGKKLNAEKGRYNGGKIPFGYKLKENKTFDVDDEKADVIHTIFDKYQEGLSTTKIVHELKSKYGDKAVGSRITLSFVNNILNNELLTGIVQKKKTIKATIHGETHTWMSYARAYPQIIEPEQFQKCREIAQANNTKADKSREYTYFAQKILRCPQCGHYMSGVGSRSYYRCYDAYNPNRALNGKDESTRCTYRATISINVIDSILWDAAARAEVFRILEDQSDKEKEYKKQISELEHKIKVADSRMEECEKKYERAYDAYIENPNISKEKYDARILKIKQEQNQILLESNNYKSQIHKIKNLLKSLKSDSLIKTLLRRIEKTKNLETPFPFRRMIEDTKEWQEICGVVFGETSDDEKKSIIRKHIASATIEDVYLPWQLPNVLKEDAPPVLHRKVILTFVDGHKDSYVVRPTRDLGDYVFHYGEGHLERHYPVPVTVKYRNKNQQKRREEAKRKREEVLKERSLNFYTIQEIMEMMGWNYGKVKYAISRKGLSAQKDGKGYIIAKSDWESWRKKQPDDQ